MLDLGEADALEDRFVLSDVFCVVEVALLGTGSKIELDSLFVQALFGEICKREKQRTLPSTPDSKAGLRARLEHSVCL